VAYTGATGTAWTVCFKLTVYPSVGYRGTLQLNPRVA
jgi:recombinational DNA repair protein RecT